MALIEAREASRGAPYERVLFTRLEFEWLRPHPPLALLDAGRTWVPAGEDNGGLNDRHWLAPRAHAAVLMRRWEALLDGSAVAALHAPTRPVPPVARVQQLFVSSEMLLAAVLRHHRLPAGRFPMLAYLGCCEEAYLDAQGRGIHSDQTVNSVLETGAGASGGAKTCFQPHCNRKRCPRSFPRWASTAAKGEPGWCGFKYDDEGSAAIINAELLALPGARFARGEGPPARVEVAVPLDESPLLGDDAAAAAARPAREGRYYFCMRCLSSQALTADSNLTAGCLFPRHDYADAALAADARKHNCRRFDGAGMAALCASFSRRGDRPDHRGDTYAQQYFPWWCKGL
jgi:hypothetical protein